MRDLRPDGLVATHDWPPGCRAVCVGTGTPPKPKPTRDHAANRATMKVLREKRIAAGLCVRCGTESHAPGHSRLCDGCIDKQIAYSAAYHRKIYKPKGGRNVGTAL